MRNKLLISLAAYLFFWWATLPAVIIEIATIQDIMRHIEEGKIVVFDIDNTLVECSQVLGSDQWFCAQMRACSQHILVFQLRESPVIETLQLGQY